MLFGIFVVLHVAALRGIDCVIATDGTVLAGEPVSSALTEDDVARDNILLCPPGYQCLSLEANVKNGNHEPPDFLAPSLFPGPSFALFAAPWALCEACRTNIKPGERALTDSCANAS